MFYGEPGVLLNGGMFIHILFITEMCPVKILKAYLDKAKIDDKTNEAFIFRALTK